MANLTANKDVPIKEPRLIAHPMAASTKILAGAFVSVNSSNYAINAGDTASTKFAGISKDLYDNSAGSAGDKEVVVIRFGVVEVPNTGTLAVGDKCYILDNQTVTDAATATNDVVFGTVVKVGSGKVWADLSQR